MAELYVPVFYSHLIQKKEKKKSAHSLKGACVLMQQSVPLRSINPEQHLDPKQRLSKLPLKSNCAASKLIKALLQCLEPL